MHPRILEKYDVTVHEGWGNADLTEFKKSEQIMIVK